MSEQTTRTIDSNHVANRGTQPWCQPADYRIVTSFFTVAVAKLPNMRPLSGNPVGHLFDGIHGGVLR